MADVQKEKVMEIQGIPGSPYSMKMVAYLRYRRIPYAFLVQAHGTLKGYPKPKPLLYPVIYFTNEEGQREAQVDSTPLIRRLETEYSGRETLPADPVTCFLQDLLEDFADEWISRIMYHYRWADEGNAEHATPMLMHWAAPQLDDKTANAIGQLFRKRQEGRRNMVGSNEITKKATEAGYKRLLGILDGIIAKQPFLFGTRASAADFAIYGQLSQLTIVEPSSAKICDKISPRVRCWVDLAGDASGVSVDESGWKKEKSLELLKPLFDEIGRTYAPLALANERAALAGNTKLEAEIDGRPWVQDVFAYQSKCLAALRTSFAALSPEHQSEVRLVLEGTGCDVFLDGKI
ncbi:glutathione S-transferase C-terminal domain-containing protein [Flexibacterium corallicola]|uniref:glutathione S-transferase C-terminal domain-containing protein n=1 Tax=Flexibacterium corallicola TaxID=3037259 RepID=UPI00286EC3FB|nr:glutathione S-transferase C-terminal domain-containing protein [Pseudovibrio sp. M1P-2-3]